MLTPHKFEDFFHFYESEPQQEDAVLMLYHGIEQKAPELLADDAAWVVKYRDKPKPKKLTPGSPFSFQITPNVTYGEIALQSEARRFLHQHQCDTAVLLSQFVQKARDHYKRPAIITSGYRPPKINAQVGGASRSEHLYDAPDTGAIDFYIDGIPTTQLQSWADAQWPYSLGYGAPKGFIHIGIRPGRPRVRWDY
jgi:hypothetical protein